MPIVTIVENFEGALTAFPNTGTWTVASNRYSGGSKSFRSTVITHNGVTTHDFTITVPAGVVSPSLSLKHFVWSETNYDFFRIYLDGVQQYQRSGYTGTWDTWTVSLAAGKTYTLRVQYSKDGSASSGEDAAYIDDVTLTYDNPVTNWTYQADDGIGVSDNPNMGWKYTPGTPPTDGWDVYLWDQAKFDIIIKKLTASETLTLSDGIKNKVSRKTSAADAVNITDVMATNLTRRYTSADTLSLADAITIAAKLKITDTVGLLDDIRKVIKDLLEDMIGVSDDIAPRLMILFQDSVALADSILKLFQSVQGDAADLVDNISPKLKVNIGDDGLTLSDDIKEKASPLISDAVVITDAITEAVKAFRADILGLADDLALRTELNLADTIALLDDIIEAVGKNDLNSATSIADDIARKLSPENLADTLESLTDDLSLEARPRAADTASIADAIVAKVQDRLDDLVSLIDAIKATVDEVQTDTAAPTDAIAIVTKRIVDDTLTLADAIATAYGTGVLKPGTFDFGKFDESTYDDKGDPVDITDEITFQMGFGVLAEDLVNLADAIKASVKDVLEGALNLSDNAVLKAKVKAGDTISLADSEDAKTGKNEGDTTTFSDNIIGSLELPRTAGDSSVTLTDSSSVKASTTNGDSVSLTDEDTGKNIEPGQGDSTGIQDTAALSVKAQLNDLLALSDDLLRSVSTVIGDTTTLSDLLQIAAKAVAAEIALDLADEDTLKVMSRLADIMNLSDSCLASIAKAINNTATVNDALANRVGALMETITTLTDSIALAVTLGLIEDAIGVADSIAKISRLTVGASFDMADWDSAAFDMEGNLIAISDSLAILISVALADNLVVSDDTKEKVKLQLSEAISLVDYVLSLQGILLASNVTISDTSSLSFLKSFSDTINLVDEMKKKWIAEAKEDVTLSDEFHRMVGATAADSISVSETLERLAFYFRNEGDAVDLSDMNYAAIGKQITDTVNLVEALQHKSKISFEEAVAAADIFGVLSRRSAADTIDLLDEIARLYRYVLGGSWDSNNWDIGQFDKTGDFLNVEDSYRFAISTLIQEAITGSDELKAMVKADLGIDLTGVSDDVQMGIIKAAAETMGVSDTLLQLVIGLKRDTVLSLTELLSKRAGLPPDDSSAVADAIVAALTIARQADELVESIDAIITKVKAIFTDAAVLTDKYAISTKHGIQEAFAVAEALGLKTKRPLSPDGVGLIDELYLKYALGIAWEDTGLADSIQGKVKTLLQQVFINGVSIPVNGLKLRHSGKDRVSTATFRIPSPTEEILSLAKQKAPVNIYLVDGVGNTDYFGGRIVGNPTKARGTITTEMEVTVDDWTAAAQDVYVIESFPEDFGTIDEALIYLWSKYYGYSTNLDKVVKTQKRMPSMVFNYLTLFDVTEKLAQLLGWSWYVEWNGAERVLQFYPPSAAVQPITLSREARNIVAGTARFGQDENMANVLYVFGGKGISNPYTQKIVADGQNTIYKLGAKPHRIDEGSNGGIKVSIVKPNGTRINQTVGVMNLHQEEEFDVLIDFNEGTVRWRDENKPQLYENGTRDIIEVIYRYTYPIMVQLTDENSIKEYGKFETTINDSSLNDVVAARELGRSILRDRAYPKGYGSCEVLVPGLRAGQFITVDLPVYNTKGLFEITEIEKWIQGSSVRRRVTLNKADDAESRIAQRLKDFAKRLASLESSNRQEDLVVQRWLKGPANIGARVEGFVAGSIEESGASHLPNSTDDYIVTLKTSGKSKTWATDKTFSVDTIQKNTKPKKNDSVTTVDKISGGITFFDVHKFDDASHPFGL
jgi:hypothetical protein